MAWYPADADQRATAIGLCKGALVGWATHPLIWLAFGPMRFLAFVLARASVESEFNADAYNAERYGSAGPLQFQPDTATALGFDEDDRYVPETAGKMAAAYVQDAITKGNVLWLPSLALPVYGWFAFAWLWRAGPESWTVFTPVTAAFDEEVPAERERGFPAIIGFRGLSLAVVFVVAWATGINLTTLGLVAAVKKLWDRLCKAVR